MNKQIAIGNLLRNFSKSKDMKKKLKKINFGFKEFEGPFMKKTLKKVGFKGVKFSTR